MEEVNPMVPLKLRMMDGVTPFFPQEIILNILKRLPVKSLIRFQCVCKHWKNPIKTQSFIAEHLHHSINHKPSLLFEHNHKGSPFHLYLLHRDMQVLELLNVPLIDPLCVRIVGSSNGLLCVEIFVQGISPPALLLSNPIIRQVKQVPRTIDYFRGNCYLGFGFSAIVNDYKIVATYAEFDDEIDRVEVYSLSTGLWKEIEFENLEGVKLYSQTFTANGAMFWYGLLRGVEEEGEEDIDLIVSFDMATEMFAWTPAPVLGSDAIFQLTVYENKLAMLSHYWSGNSCFYDLWVMDEGIGACGERWSWTKIFTTNCSGMLIPYGVWRNEIVCNICEIPGLISENECEGENEKITVLSLLNVGTNELKKFTTRRCGSSSSIIFNHVESLVPVGNIHIEELFS